MLTKVATTKAPAAIGPYSQGIIVNGMLYASGQIPIIPATGEIAQGDITVQAKQVMLNIGEILKEAGTAYENVVKTTCFLYDMADFAAFNAVYEQYFTGRSDCGSVKDTQTGLQKKIRIEIYNRMV